MFHQSPPSSGHMLTPSAPADWKMKLAIMTALVLCTVVRFSGNAYGALAVVAAPIELPEPSELKEIDLNQSVYVSFEITNNAEANIPAGFHANISQHPEWIMTYGENRVINENALRSFFQGFYAETFQRIEHAVVDSVQSGAVLRANLKGNVRDGLMIDAPLAARLLREAFEDGESTLSIPVSYEESRIMMRDGNRVIGLKRLARGISDFDKSGLARQANIHKALEQHMNGVMIKPGETFSFNTAMSDDEHWHEALVIVNGTDLVPEPGGGICQAATTAFRAALLAGLPIEKRANHSLYVGYYEEYGVGLDATVYNDKQDFVFRNDTTNTIVMLARVEGTKAIVELYGVPDNRTVKIDGPFFAQNAPEEIKFYGNPLTTNQIAWTREVVKADGTTADETLISTYKGFPRQLWKKYVEDNSKMLLVSL